MSDPKLSIIGDYILVKPEKPKAVTESGIILPEKSREPAQMGKVLAVGSGRRREYFELDDDGKTVHRRVKRVPLEVREGDQVIFPKHAGMELDEYLMLREDQVLAVYDSDS